jgi:hypothetical protein
MTVLICGDTTFIAGLHEDRFPFISMHRQAVSTAIIHSKRLFANQLDKITCLVQDQSAADSSQRAFNVAAFYAPGSFSIFTIPHDTTDSHIEESRIYTPPTVSDRTTNVLAAAYHNPLLVTLSATFHVSLYEVAGDKVAHRQTLSSFTSYAPSSLTLSCPSAKAFKLILAYSVPVYPSHWGVAVTELSISPASYSVTSSKSRRAFDLPFGFIDEANWLLAREQWSRKVTHVRATATDGKWVAFAGSDNNIQIYRLSKSRKPGLGIRGEDQLTFVRTLFGHIGSIHSLALADGRCVSLGTDGSLWVWDLEMDWGVEVQRGEENARLVGPVVFDERRILCVRDRKLEVSSFDV